MSTEPGEVQNRQILHLGLEIALPSGWRDWVELKTIWSSIEPKPSQSNDRTNQANFQ